MMTDDEYRVQEIEKRVRASICPSTTEGRISEQDLQSLLASRMAWRLVACHKESLENLNSSEMNTCLRQALEDTTADLLVAQETIEALTTRVAIYEKQFMRSTTSMALN